MRKDGKFVGVDGNIPEGQGIVMAHLNECHELLEMVSFSILLWFPVIVVLIQHTPQLKERMDEGITEDEEFEETTFDSESDSDDDQ